MNEINIEFLEKVAKSVRRSIVKMHAKSESSHIGSALSIVDILVNLYFKVLRIDPSKPNDNKRDRLLLSKGHAVSALYAILAHRGFFSKEMLSEYCQNGSKLPGHSTMNSVPGVEISTGSLGHGLAIGAGIALAAKLDKMDYRVFVILSDGECDEGEVWESALFASHYKLDNLTAIVDYNKIQAFGRTNEVLNLEPFLEKWRTFNWQGKELDGHNFQEMIETFNKLPFEKEQPNIIIAHTIKGKGVSFMENSLTWHYRSPNPEEMKKALDELV